MQIYLQKLKESIQVENFKYFHWYSNIIEKGLSRPKDKRKINFYTERHHILPRCLCKSEEEKKDINNIVLLSLKEHALAHKLLSKSAPSSHKLKRAYFGMYHARTENQMKINITSRDYEFFKINSKSIYGRKGKENGMFGKKHSNESKEKIRQKAKNRKVSEITRSKMRLNNSKEDNPFFGKRHSRETKQNISNQLKGKTTYVKCYELTDTEGNLYKIFTKENLKRFTEQKNISYKKIEEFLNKGIIVPPKSLHLMREQTKNALGWSAICKTIPISSLFTVL